jgi:hypothetical protein
MSKETKTITHTEQWDGNLKDLEEFSDVLSKHKENVIPTPIFIIFAEYMGYLSQFNKKAEDWCDGKVPDVHIQKVMILEASCIFRQMKKDYAIEEIQYYYDSYYPLILKEYVDKLEEILKD